MSTPISYVLELTPKIWCTCVTPKGAKKPKNSFSNSQSDQEYRILDLIFKSLTLPIINDGDSNDLRGSIIVQQNTILQDQLYIIGLPDLYC